MALEPWVESCPEEEILLSVITVSELLHGVHRAVEPARRAIREAYVEGVIGRFTILPLDLAIARVHGRLSAELAVRGVLIGSHDLWLAASCLAHGFMLATANRREFERIPGLRVEFREG